VGDWILAVEGTPAAASLAVVLALVSALAHASFGALQKASGDPWAIRAAIDLAILALALPVALLAVPAPTPTLWAILAGVWVLHTGYKALQTAAYVRGAYTVVYPVARGTAPVCTVLLAWAAFGETFTPGQWLGVALLSLGIMGLGAANLRGRSLQPETLRPALLLALATGVSIAAYTTWDAWGIRLAADPFTFLAWFFVIDGWAMPLLWWRLRRKALAAEAAAEAPRIEGWVQPGPSAAPPAALPAATGPIRPHLLRGLIGAGIAFVSFGAVMLATRLGHVGEAVAVRETSVVFAVLIGWLFLREPIGPARAGIMAVIAAGAALVELGAAG
jgi:drug/metabolite transporter (DMT)-like permease